MIESSQFRGICLFLIQISAICTFISGCALKTETIPVIEGNKIVINKDKDKTSEARFPRVKIKWFGTASYEISLEEGSTKSISVLTDPFVSYQGISKLLYSTINSDTILVSETIGSIRPPPKAIFIGHSHYDHMLDAVVALKHLDEGYRIPVYGSETAKHILAGYKKDYKQIDNGICGTNVGLKILNQRDLNWSDNWCEVQTNGDWKNIYQDKLFFRSFEANHAPHIKHFTLWDGYYTEDLTHEPKYAREFLKGNTYIHFFKFINENNTRSFVIGLVGAATELPVSLNNFSDPVDVLILCVPGWDKVKHYPKNLIRVLKPRYIILSHFDNFLDESRDERPTRLAPTSKLNDFLNMVQEDINSINSYEDFNEIILPGVGSTLYID